MALNRASSLCHAGVDGAGVVDGGGGIGGNGGGDRGGWGGAAGGGGKGGGRVGSGGSRGRGRGGTAPSAKGRGKPVLGLYPKRIAAVGPSPIRGDDVRDGFGRVYQVLVDDELVWLPAGEVPASAAFEYWSSCLSSKFAKPRDLAIAILGADHALTRFDGTSPFEPNLKSFVSSSVLDLQVMRFDDTRDNELLELVRAAVPSRRE